MDEARIGPGPYVHHVYPVEVREHVTSGDVRWCGPDVCWCGPDLYRLCTACDGDDPGCWRCGGEGIVPVGVIVPGDRVIVVHHLIPDDATFVIDWACEIPLSHPEGRRRWS